MRKRSVYIVIVLTFGWLSSTLYSQFLSHPISKPVPSSKPVTELSGINVLRNSVADVIKQLGKPSQVTSDPLSDNLKTILRYEWEGRDWSLRVTSAGSYLIVSVDVWGRRSDGEIGRTGEGLTLGATIVDARRIYGSRFCSERYFMGSWLTCPGGTRYQVDSPFNPPPRAFVAGSTVLEIDYDHDGTITHMKLKNPPPEW